MRQVSIADLKARLSMHIREVRRGGEVQVLDRGVPVARIIRIDTATLPTGSERRQRLIAAGTIRPGSGDSSEVLRSEPLRVSTSILDALGEGRLDRF